VQPFDRVRGPLTGVVVATGRAGALTDDRFVVVRDRANGLVAARVADTAESRRMVPGAVVELGGARDHARRLRDQVLAVARRDGTYTPAAHRALLQGAHPPWQDARARRRVAAAVRFLERAAERAGSGVERLGAETFRVEGDGFSRARRGGRVFARVRSAIPLDRQVTLDAPTWLDRQLRAKRPSPFLDHPQIQEAATKREAWLVARGYGGRQGQRAATVPTDRGLARLAAAERMVFADTLAREQAGPAWTLARGTAVSGTYAGLMELPSGPRALVKSEQGLHVVRVGRAPEIAPGTPVRAMRTRERGVELFRQPAPPARQREISRGYGLGL
jgi:hypothetical protein